jgi:hypothetical protein
VNGKSGKYTVLILVIAAFAVAGCSPPMGSIGQGLPSIKAFDGLQVTSPLSYDVGGSFKKSDITVYAIYRDNNEKKLVTNESNITVIQNFGQTSEERKTVPPDYPFTIVGTYYILVEYQNLSLLYPITVVSNITGPQPPGIIVKWADPKDK